MKQAILIQGLDLGCMLLVILWYLKIIDETLAYTRNYIKIEIKKNE